MTLFTIETQSDSILIDIEDIYADDKESIKDILKEYLKDRNYYYTDGLIVLLREHGLNVKKVIPIKINWWEIQPIKGTDKMIDHILKGE